VIRPSGEEVAPGHRSAVGDLDAALARLGYASFRPGQREAIETLLAVGRLLLVAPTGGGKSLTYQLPATMLDGTAVVISPLIALMHDQAQALGQRGVAATFFSATLDSGEVRRRMARTATGAFKLIYVAPERLVFPGFRNLLRDLAVSLVAVDEAHCISEWGHDFRPEYLQIGDLLSELRAPRVLACTATATPIVRDEILVRLGLGPDTPQLLQGFARPNLILRAIEVSGARERAAHVDGILAEALGQPGAGRGIAIVYAPTRRGAEEEGARLAVRGWRCAVYHAGLDAASRSRAQEAFATGSLDVVAATVAFGMGIDRPDVRAVVHLAPPGSLEAYYQEVGRAGRDGAPAWGLLLVSPGDMGLRRRLLEASEGATPAIVEHKWSLYLELMRWVEGGSCRHDGILRYFGDEAETLAGCGHCDVCEALAGVESEQDPEAATLLVRKALSGVARVHGRFGMTAAVQLLRGTDDLRLSRSGLDTTKTFGVLRDRSEEWLQRLLRRCVTAGWIDFSSGDRPVVRLTDSGRAVMKGDRPARLLLPGTDRRVTAGPSPRRAARSRARAALPPPDGASAALFEALRAHRLALARAQGVAPFVIASDRTLRDLAAARPGTLAGLEAIYGIGPAKAAKYGHGFLEVIARGEPEDRACDIQVGMRLQDRADVSVLRLIVVVEACVRSRTASPSRTLPSISRVSRAGLQPP
jgi:ATP-dependent DNA helicase RecQ